MIGWDTECRKDFEAWAEYARRTAEESVAAVEELNAEAGITPEEAGQVYYNLTFVGEAEYSGLSGE